MNANSQINEMIQGMLDACGGVPSDEVERQIAKLREEKEDNVKSNWHGWECYCSRCSM